MNTNYNKSRKSVLVLSFGFIFTFAIISSPLSLLAESPNLIQNPNLDTSVVAGIPDHWLEGGFGLSTSTFSYPVIGQSGTSTDNAANITVSNYQNGDAKWYFEPVPISTSTSYLFTDSYKSDVPTELIALYYDANHLPLSPTDPGSRGWAGLVLASGEVWATTTDTFSPPVGASYMTVFHLIQSNGSLTTDNYSLTALPPPPKFGNGVVTLTFDDGWESQYTNALPILESAGYHGSFYLISSTLIPGAVVDPNILCNDLLESFCDGAVIEVASSSFRASSQYPDPNVNTYTFSENFDSTATSTMTVSYFDNSGVPIAGEQDLILQALGAGLGQNTSVTFIIPPAVFALISTSTHSSPLFTITHSVPTGETLQVSNPKLIKKRASTDFYMVPSQVLQMQALGQEIGAHTVDHCNLASLDIDPNTATTTACASIMPTALSADYEIANSRTAIQALGVAPVDTFVYPYGGFNAHVESLVGSHGFISSRTVNIGYNTPLSDLFALNTQIINKSLTEDSNGLNMAKSWIDYARSNKVWLILTFHNVQTTEDLIQNEALLPGSVAEATSVSFFQGVIDYLKSQNVCVATMHDATVAIKSSIDPCAPALSIDKTAPVISNMPSDITLYTDTSASLPVTYTNPIATDDSGGAVTLGCSPVSGSMFSLGTSTVTCTATDPSNNSSSKSFSVGLVYTPAPALQGSSSGGGGIISNSSGHGNSNTILTSILGQVLGASTTTVATTTEIVTVESLRAKLAGLYKMVLKLQFKLANCSSVFNNDLSFGMNSSDVKNLQMALNSSVLTQLSNSSKGHETNYFGNLTRNSVMKLQNIFSDEILRPMGLTAPNGIVGSTTRAVLNNLCSVK